MKKLTIIVAAILSLSACKKEDKVIPTPDPINYTLSGNWKLVQEVKNQTNYTKDSIEWIFNKTNCDVNSRAYTIDNTTSFITFQAVNGIAKNDGFSAYVQSQDSNSLELFRNDSTTLIFVR